MFKNFRSYYRPHKKLLIIVLLSVIGYTCIELSLPFFTRIILNTYVPLEDLSTVFKIGIGMIILIIGHTGLQYSVTYFGHILGTEMENSMRQKAFGKIQQLPFSYFDTNKTGVMMSRLTTDLRDAGEIAHHGVEEVLSITIMLVVGYIYLAGIHFFATNILFLLTFLLLCLVFIARKKMVSSFRLLKIEQGEINSRLEGAISGVRLTRAFANESYEKKRFAEDGQKYLAAYRRAYRALGETVCANSFFIQALNIIVLVGGSLLVIQGEFSIGDLFAYFLYFNLLATPVRKIMSMLETLQQGYAGFERFEQLMAEPLVIEDKIGAKILHNPKGEIQFNNVTFSYKNESANILSSFDLKIESGEMVALVGPSGVGKTTIAQLIPRFYELASGSISIDGVDIKEYTLQSLRENIGYVQQDVIMFYGTIAENILYGKPGASFAEVENAAKAAGIHDFIISMPGGYQTLVGERGVMLSGGQKQRISLSRIFLKNPKILILDEATSALDNITEAYIQESIEKLSKNRTVLVVAHRLSTVQNADEIIVLDKIGIVQKGKHLELLAEEGHYKELHTSSILT
ncbi:lipid ABC transporter permease/ATPase [Erysipelotrichaceae bacterium]|nr:lipid ABC transporter permease/ATPase [Erysipelotrichaceae bacterium]